MYVVKSPYLLKKLYPACLTWNMPRRENAVYLTFDDGPIPEVTPWVLETLSQYAAQATFFCIGDNVRKHPGIYQRIREEGHAVGNHTFNHLNGWKTPDDVYIENVRQCAGLVNSSLFRPPYGRIRRRQVRRLVRPDTGDSSRPLWQRGSSSPAFPAAFPGSPSRERPAPGNGYRIIMWDVLSGDFDPGLSPEKCLRNVLKYTEKGSIVVFHDSLKAERRLRYVLPRALQYWQEKEFKLNKIIL